MGNKGRQFLLLQKLFPGYGGGGGFVHSNGTWGCAARKVTSGDVSGGGGIDFFGLPPSQRYTVRQF